MRADTDTPRPAQQDVTGAALARVEGAKGRADAATPGPWRVMVKGNTVQSLAIFGVCSGISSKTGNASFIAHSRADVPLLAAIAAAAIELRQWETSPPSRPGRLAAIRAARGQLDAAIRAATEAQP